MNQEINHAIQSVVNFLLAKQWKLATAESCTGGGIAYHLTEFSGASTWFERGFVTYSNESKHELLNVPTSTIEQYGAVSEETARAMALGALEKSHAHVAISVTGIAGPSGGGKDKPIGTVWFALATPEGVITERHVFSGDRHAIRLAAIAAGILLLSSERGGK